MIGALRRHARRALGWARSPRAVRALLLLAAVGCAVAGVADRVTHLRTVPLMLLTACGLALGGMLAAADLRPGRAGLVGGGLGLSLVLLGFGGLGRAALRLVGAYGRALWALPARLRYGTRLPSPEVHAAAINLRGATVSLLLRFKAWTIALTDGEPRFDPLVAAVIWGMVLWAAAAWAGWWSRRRRRVLVALAPCSGLLLLAFYLAWGSHAALLAFLLAMLLLLALTAYDRRLERWRIRCVDRPELGLQTTAVTAFLAIALVTAGYALPSLEVGRVLSRRPSRQPEPVEPQGGAAEALGLETQTDAQAIQPYGEGLPRSHLIGAGPGLEEQVVMVIEVGDGPSRPDGSSDRPAYYWRSHTYDIYTGSGWSTTPVETWSYWAETPAVTRSFSAERMVVQRVRRVADSVGLVNAAGTVVSVDRDFVVAWRSEEDPYAAWVRADAYEVDSLVSAASAQELRRDDGAYPGWVLDRYLALPDSVPERVLALAESLGSETDAAYERARAIEGYLRQFPYTLDVPEVAADQDVVDAFLFELERGYCDHYASAMVVLARAAGLPARLAVGYGPGTYDADDGAFVVTEADAHAWPEIYFPEYGWIRFEPTAPFAPPAHEGGSGDLSAGLSEDQLWMRRKGLRGVPWLRLAAGVGGLLAIAGLGWTAVDAWRLARQDPETVLRRLYGSLAAHAWRLGGQASRGATPGEVGGAVASWLSEEWGRLSNQDGWPGSSLRRLAESASDGAEGAVALAEIYSRGLYGGRSLEEKDRSEALRLWRGLRWWVRLARLAEVMKPRGSSDGRV